MNRAEIGFALVLSVPVGVGVAGAVIVSTAAQAMTLAVASGVVAWLAIFGLVALGVGESADGTEGPSLADRLLPSPSESTPADVLLGAGLGACVTVFLWYIPMSPTLGGAAAGALQGGDRGDARLAGFVAGAFVPLVVLAVGIGVFLLAGGDLFGRFPFGVPAAVAAAVAGTAYAVVFSTVGGHIAGYFVDQERAWGEPEANER